MKRIISVIAASWMFVALFYGTVQAGGHHGYYRKYHNYRYFGHHKYRIRRAYPYHYKYRVYVPVKPHGYDHCSPGYKKYPYGHEGFGGPQGAEGFEAGPGAPGGFEEVQFGGNFEIPMTGAFEEEGQVFLRLAGVRIRVRVIQWGPKVIQVAMPNLGLDEPLNGTLEVMVRNQVADQRSIRLTPPGAEGVQDVPTTGRPDGPVEPELISISPGQEFTFEGGEIGREIGRVLIKVGGLTLSAEVLEWTAPNVLVRIPNLEIAESTQAVLEIYLANGGLVKSQNVQFTPGRVVGSAPIPVAQ